MPGSKRKLDEDTWLVLQSKKLKCGQILANVYEATLAKLRLGARLSFASAAASASDSSRITVTSPSVSSSASALDDLNLNESGIGNQIVPISVPSPRASASACTTSRIEQVICQGCVALRQRGIPQNATTFANSCQCTYCEKLACHVEECKRCSGRFCVNCCIQKYDDPYSETFVCISCLG